MSSRHPVEHSTIEADEAVLFWNPNFAGDATPKVFVGRKGDRYPGGGHDGYNPPGCIADFGAYFLKWTKEYTDRKRVQTLVHYALELIVVHGCDPREVVRQLCKVRQFYDLGERSYPMRHVISTATLGHSRSDWPPGSGE
jgi:hypothetical protein